MKKIQKGKPGYLNYKKKVEIIRTIVYFAIVLAIFALGIWQTGTRLNLLTVVAILGCLPASKSLVGVIARFPYPSIDPDKAKENNIEMKYWNRLQKGETIELPDRILTSDLVLGPARKGIKCTYTTDTRPTASIIEHAKASDLFICEGMYGEPDKKAKAVEYKHMTFYEAAEIAKKAEVKKMWLTHYSPSLVRPEMYLEEVRKIFAHTSAGKDGKSTTLLFEEE